MRALVDQLALLVTTGGLVAAAVAGLVSRRPAVALPVLLDLLTAAGLLRLAVDPDLPRALGAAAIVALRHLLVAGLHAGGTKATAGRNRTVADAAADRDAGG